MDLDALCVQAAVTIVRAAVEDKASIGLEAVQQLQAALLGARLPDPAAQEFFRACVVTHMGPGLKAIRRSKSLARTLSPAISQAIKARPFAGTPVIRQDPYTF